MKVYSDSFCGWQRKASTVPRHRAMGSDDLMANDYQPRKGGCEPHSPDRDAAADGAVQHLGGFLDALGGRIQCVRDRGLGGLGAIHGRDADVAQGFQLFLQRADSLARIEQIVADRQRRHHGQPRIADLAELAAQPFDPRFQALGQLEQPHLLSLLASHAVLPAVDGDVDVAHSSSPSSSPSESSSSAFSLSPSPSTARILPIAASSRSAISRLARSSLRDFTNDPSSSSARRERSAPRAWIRVASSSSSRSASRRRSTALSSASSALISRRVAASMSTKGGSKWPELLTGRSFMRCATDLPGASRAGVKSPVRQAFTRGNLRGSPRKRNAVWKLCTRKQLFRPARRWPPGTEVLSNLGRARPPSSLQWTAP